MISPARLSRPSSWTNTHQHPTTTKKKQRAYNTCNTPMSRTLSVYTRHQCLLTEHDRPSFSSGSDGPHSSASQGDLRFLTYSTPTSPLFVLRPHSARMRRCRFWRIFGGSSKFLLENRNFFCWLKCKYVRWGWWSKWVCGSVWRPICVLGRHRGQWALYVW